MSCVCVCLLHDCSILQLEAYSPQEKGAIGVTHLWPKQLLRHGLGSPDVVSIEPLQNRVVEHIAENYTREAGVRQLERCLASICRYGMHCIAPIYLSIIVSCVNLNPVHFRCVEKAFPFFHYTNKHMNVIFSLCVFDSS